MNDVEEDVGYIRGVGSTFINSPDTKTRGEIKNLWIAKKILDTNYIIILELRSVEDNVCRPLRRSRVLDK